ncbi:MAG TPA: MBL fold metallo-hydrolase [Steroidobacteraceae bacterium]|jgi:glyoxylase-like metal-dependent hydrolase (beta-lactamase superfamily II)
MGARPFRCGLEELGDGLYAWMQPDGGWGWSNAGFVRDGDDALLVDTLFDEALTAVMLQALEGATGIAPGQIRQLVNTHANGDHTHGNALVANAEVIASAAAAREMAELPPAMVAQVKAAGAAGALGDAGTYFAEIFAPFDFARARGRAPTRTFEQRLDLTVGDKAVELHRLGPAHTAGDVLVWVPHDRSVFTGDLLFIDVTPIMWAGPVGNWLAACDRILALGAENIVPGHGPMTDAAGVRRLQEYLRWVDREARQRFDSGLALDEAILDIAPGVYRHWLDAERLAVNVASLYREYAGDTSGPDVVAMFGLMAKLKRRL